MTREREAGFVATELVLGIGLLVVPVALVVLTLPGWSERQVTARVISREVARRIARDGVCDVAGSRALGATMARNLGVPGRTGGGRRVVRGRRRARARRRRRGPGDGDDARGRAARHRRDRCVVVDGAPPGARRSLRGRAVSEPDDAGTVTLWLLGLCLMLFALGGISLDLWRSFSERRSLAATADAAALAGASAIDEDEYRASGALVLEPALAEARARAHVATQLDRTSLRDVDVHADRDAVTVVVHGRVGFTLLGVLVPHDDLDVRVTATATPLRSG